VPAGKRNSASGASPLSAADGTGASCGPAQPESGSRVAEDAELHVLEVGHQDAVLEAYAGAVAGGHPGAAELDVVDADLPVADHPYGLVLGGLARCEAHRAPADPTQGEGSLRPNGHVAPVGASADQHCVAIAGEARGVGNAGDGFPGPDGDLR